MGNLYHGALFILLRILISEGFTYITENEETWVDAKEKCTMETPTIRFSGKDFPVNYSLTGSDVWVGYYLSATAFHYIGCMEVENMTAKVVFDHNTPGLCYSACMKENSIGMSENKCFCLNDIDQSKVHNIECKSGCTGHKDIACGVKNFMSLYRIESAAESYTGDGECLRFETNSGGANSNPIWSNCKDDNKVICALSNGTVQNALDGKEKQFKSWRESMNICFRLQILPTSIEQLKDYDSVTPSWTGVITSDVIYSIDDDVITNSSRKFGYLHKQVDYTVLKFHDEDSAKKKTLCKIETTTRTTTSTPPSGNSPTKPGTYSTHQTTTVSSDTESSSNKGFTPTTFTKSSTYSTKETTTVSSDTESSSNKGLTPTTFTKSSTYSTKETTAVSGDHESSSNKGFTPTSSSRTSSLEKSSDIGVPVGISIGILLIVIIVVITAVLLKRRRKLPTLCCRKPKSEKSEKRTIGTTLVNNKAYEIPSNSPYDQIDEVAPQPSIGTINEVSEDDGHYAHTYLVLESNTRDSETENDFAESRLNIKTDDVYNKLNSNLHHRNKFEDTYDTTEKAAKMLKEQHDKEVAVGEKSKIDDTDEDDYNHINGTIIKNGYTDNVYGYHTKVSTNMEM